MLSDSPKGQTHYQGDGCKDEHGKPITDVQVPILYDMYGNVVLDSCKHEWKQCEGGICTSDLHSYHCTICSRHGFAPIKYSKQL